MDRRPAFPIRRMIAVGVLFAGLIGPLLILALRLLGSGVLGVLVAPVLAAVAVWLYVLARFLWKGNPGAWRVSLVVFVSGVLVGGLIVAIAAASGDRETVLIGAATLAYFGCGLAAVCSLHGRWMQQKEWAPAVDPLATADKAAILRALRRR